MAPSDNRCRRGGGGVRRHSTMIPPRIASLYATAAISTSRYGNGKKVRGEHCPDHWQQPPMSIDLTPDTPSTLPHKRARKLIYRTDGRSYAHTRCPRYLDLSDHAKIEYHLRRPSRGKTLTRNRVPCVVSQILSALVINRQHSAIHVAGHHISAAPGIIVIC